MCHVKSTVLICWIKFVYGIVVVVIFKNLKSYFILFSIRKPPLPLIPHLRKRKKQSLIRRLLTQSTILNTLYRTGGHSGFLKMIKAKLGKQTFD